MLPLSGVLLLTTRVSPATWSRGKLPIRCDAGIDPFRPARPPIEPMVINAIQELFGSDGSGTGLKVAGGLGFQFKARS